MQSVTQETSDGEDSSSDESGWDNSGASDDVESSNAPVLKKDLNKVVSQAVRTAFQHMEKSKQRRQAPKARGRNRRKKEIDEEKEQDTNIVRSRFLVCFLH